MKHVSGVCKFVALLLMFALPAVASAPIFTVTPFTPLVIASGPGGCPSFDVLLAPQAGRPNKGKVITFANGSSISTGAVFVTATNLTSNKSINLNISGPGQFSVSDNTFTVFGASLDIGFQNVPPANLPSNLVFAHGQAVLQFDNSAPPQVTSISFVGAAPQDVCQSLE
jgi:hypothetical protein